MDIDAKDVQNFGNRLELLEMEFENLHFWNWIRKRQLEKEIERATVAYRSALYYFGRDYHVNPRDIAEKIAQIEEKIKALEPKIAMKNTQISKLMERQAEVKQEYNESKFMIFKKPQQELDYFIEPSNITGLKQSVMGFMQELCRDADEQRRRKKVMEIKRAIKPKRMLMLASSMQQKRSLAAVLGKYYRKTAEDARPISSLPIKKHLAV
jgi:Mg2+ and Co2+ transporter CorA